MAGCPAAPRLGEAPRRHPRRGDTPVRAVMFTDPGPASVLHLVERPIPVVGPGEVRVRVVVSGVNPTDVGARSGRGTTDGTPGPHVPNQDGAGIVDAVGPGVSGLAVG